VWPELVDELEAFEFSVTDQGHVRTNAPSGMHDDCVIALALAAAHVAHRPARSSVLTFWPEVPARDRRRDESPWACFEKLLW
jgi:hypothetical protein